MRIYFNMVPRATNFVLKDGVEIAKTLNYHKKKTISTNPNAAKY